MKITTKNWVLIATIALLFTHAANANTDDDTPVALVLPDNAVVMEPVPVAETPTLNENVQLNENATVHQEIFTPAVEYWLYDNMEIIENAYRVNGAVIVTDNDNDVDDEVIAFEDGNSNRETFRETGNDHPKVIFEIQNRIITRIWENSEIAIQSTDGCSAHSPKTIEVGDPVMELIAVCGQPDYIKKEPTAAADQKPIP